MVSRQLSGTETKKQLGEGTGPISFSAVVEGIRVENKTGPSTSELKPAGDGIITSAKESSCKVSNRGEKTGMGKYRSQVEVGFSVGELSF
ncbi:hypothetical protein JTB14_011682 [Gonioctena quinquepunctata]|nr:hypothetical protein JTB14_011682 [Gonioctena quinquepunctata]